MTSSLFTSLRHSITDCDRSSNQLSRPNTIFRSSTGLDLVLTKYEMVFDALQAVQSDLLHFFPMQLLFHHATSYVIC